jgi:hypothetical protein
MPSRPWASKDAVLQPEIQGLIPNRDPGGSTYPASLPTQNQKAMFAAEFQHLTTTIVTTTQDSQRGLRLFASGLLRGCVQRQHVVQCITTLRRGISYLCAPVDTSPTTTSEESRGVRINGWSLYLCGNAVCENPVHMVLESQSDKKMRFKCLTKDECACSPPCLEAPRWERGEVKQYYLPAEYYALAVAAGVSHAVRFDRRDSPTTIRAIVDHVDQDLAVGLAFVSKLAIFIWTRICRLAP